MPGYAFPGVIFLNLKQTTMFTKTYFKLLGVATSIVIGLSASDCGKGTDGLTAEEVKQLKELLKKTDKIPGLLHPEGVEIASGYINAVPQLARAFNNLDSALTASGGLLQVNPQTKMYELTPNAKVALVLSEDGKNLANSLADEIKKSKAFGSEKTLKIAATPGTCVVTAVAAA